MTRSSDQAKHAAAAHVIDTFVKDGMRLGLGSGSTAEQFIRLLGARVADGLNVSGVPSSKATAALAHDHAIALIDLNDVVELDLTVDGADEVDAEFRMIKGGGGCLTREKIVAQASRRMVVLIDDSKLVNALGAFPLPVEVNPFGWRSTRQLIVDTLAESGADNVRIELRGGENKPFVTDNRNFIVDCHIGRVDYPNTLTCALNTIPGVVENGLFVREADTIVIGRADGSAHRLTRPVSEI